MAFGNFAGGLADSLNQGFQRNQQADFQQQELKLQQQGQQLTQQRFQQAQYMELYNQGVQHMADFFDQWKLAHPDGDIKQAAAAMAPTKDNLKQLLKNLGQNPDSIEGLWAGMIAAPSKAETEKPDVKTMTGPGGEQTMYAVNPRLGTAKQIAGTEQTDNVSGLEGNTLRDALAKRSGLTPDQLDVGAAQLNDGNISALTNLGRGRQGGEAVKSIRAWAAYKLIHDEGLSPQEAADRVNANTAEYKATQAGATQLGRREAQVIGAATTAMQTAPRVIQASRAVSKTNYPSVNAIVNAALQGTGDENVIRLGIAINTFVNNYARALGAGNSAVTNSARAEAFDNLNKAWSQGQIEAAIDQMLNKELPSEITGAHEGIREFLRKKNSGNTFAPGETQTGGSVQELPPGAKLPIAGSSGNVRFSFTPGQ